MFRHGALAVQVVEPPNIAKGIPGLVVVVLVTVVVVVVVDVASGGPCLIIALTWAMALVSAGQGLAPGPGMQAVEVSKNRSVYGVPVLGSIALTASTR